MTLFLEQTKKESIPHKMGQREYFLLTYFLMTNIFSEVLVIFLENEKSKKKKKSRNTCNMLCSSQIKANVGRFTSS